MIIYAAAMILVLAGIITVMTKENLVKKVIGLSVFSNGINLLLVSIGYRAGGIAPMALIEIPAVQLSSIAVDPLPQALVLTSIVISFSVTAVALSLIVQAYRKFHTMESDKIRTLRG